MTRSRRVVVMVSGGGAISPFTTPTSGCATGLSAGSTDTGMREALLGAGVPVYTSPANIGRLPVTNDPDINGFDGHPEQLPAELTVNAAGSIDVAGQQEVGVERVGDPPLDGPLRGDERLPDHLATEDAGAPHVLRLAAEQVHLELLEVHLPDQGREDFVHGSLQCGLMRRWHWCRMRVA